MKIGIITHNYPSNAQPYLQPFIRDQLKVLIKSERYDPRVIVPSPHVIPFTKRWKSGKSPLLDSPLSKRFKYFSVPRRLAPGVTGSNLARNLRKNTNESIDILHVHWLYPNGLAIPKIGNKFRCILNIHGTDWHSTKDDPRLSEHLPKILNSTSAIVVSGDEIKEELLTRYPGLDVRVSYNFIDTDLFSLPDSDMRNNAKKKLSFDPKKTHILTVANIRPEKGIDLYLDAISNLDKSDLVFHIIGQSPTGFYEKTISQKLRSLKHNNVVIHSPVERGYMPYFYHAADAYFLPSRSEGFNVSLLESLSTGLYTISTRTGGANSVLSNNRGLLVEPESVSSITEALVSLSEKKMFNRSSKSRSFILNNHSLHHYADFLDNLYSDVMHQS